MTRKHLMWWIIDYLSRNHSMLLANMEELKGDADNQWVNKAFNDAIEDWEN